MENIIKIKLTSNLLKQSTYTVVYDDEKLTQKLQLYFNATENKYYLCRYYAYLKEYLIKDFTDWKIANECYETLHKTLL